METMHINMLKHMKWEMTSDLRGKESKARDNYENSTNGVWRIHWPRNNIENLVQRPWNSRGADDTRENLVVCGKKISLLRDRAYTFERNQIPAWRVLLLEKWHHYVKYTSPWKS